MDIYKFSIKYNCQYASMCTADDQHSIIASIPEIAIAVPYWRHPFSGYWRLGTDIRVQWELIAPHIHWQPLLEIDKINEQYIVLIQTPSLSIQGERGTFTAELAMCMQCAYRYQVNCNYSILNALTLIWYAASNSVEGFLAMERCIGSPFAIHLYIWQVLKCIICFNFSEGI